MLQQSISISGLAEIKLIVQWAQKFRFCLFLNPSNSNKYPYKGFPHRLAFSNSEVALSGENNFDSLKKCVDAQQQGELYGFLSYDLKEETHKIESNNKCQYNWPLAGFFKPEAIIEFEANKATIKADNAEQICETIRTFLKQTTTTIPPNAIGKIEPYVSSETYLNTVKKLQDHIVEGDIYEINYCINYEAQADDFSPLETFFKLSAHSPTPFASFLKWDEKYILCASPERFVKLIDNKIISQPIKGTAKRSAVAHEDEQLRENLKDSEKERAENMMIVDLVRNDLAQSAVPGSVKVEEFFGIYSFEYVHQMISTVVAEKRKNISALEVIKNAFPMGSMTGAPKQRAIELIEFYENSKRSVFSGAIGYINKEAFDFNVVIRSIYYDSKSGWLNYQVGSAITFDSDPEEEYRECQLKAEAIKRILLA